MLDFAMNFYHFELMLFFPACRPKVLMLLRHWVPTTFNNYHGWCLQIRNHLKFHLKKSLLHLTPGDESHGPLTTSLAAPGSFIGC